MLKQLALLLAVLLTIPVPAVADGIWIPPQIYKTYDFTAVSERQQYAAIEVLSKYFKKMSIYLALMSADFAEHNITVVVPLMSIPQDVTGNKINSSEFLIKHGFGYVENLTKEQSVAELARRTLPVSRDAVGGYFMLSVFTPFYKLIEMPLFVPMYRAMVGAAEMALPRELPPGVTPITRYEFEGVTVDIYGVASGQILADFMADYYQLTLPDNVRTAVDKYRNHYIAVIQTAVGPPEGTALLKARAPRALAEAIEYIRANPRISLTCRVDYYHPYRECTDREAIRQKFADIISRAEAEAAPDQNLIDLTNKAKIYRRLVQWASGDIDKKTYRVGIITGPPKPENWANIFRGTNIQFELIHSTDYTTVDFARYDVVIIERYKQINAAEEAVIKAYLAGRRGVILISGVPSCMVRQRDLYLCAERLSDGIDITDWFGARRYENWGGNFLIDRSHYVTQDFSPGDIIGSCPRGCGAISDTQGISLASADGRSTLLHIYEPASGGRVAYFSSYPIEAVTGVAGITDISNAMVDFFLAAYSNTTRGFELSMTLPMQAEIYYPLGTGIAWATPIEDTRILVKMHRDLDASFTRTQASAIDSEHRYFMWSFSNWNPDYDIAGKIEPAGVLTGIRDAGKRLVETLNANTWLLGGLLLIIAIAIAGVVVLQYGKGAKERRQWFVLALALLGPILSVWLVAVLAYVFKTAPAPEEARENLLNALAFLGVLLVIWAILTTLALVGG